MKETLPFIVRNGILHIHYTKDGKRHRFSTKLMDSVKNRAFVKENLHKIIKAREEALRDEIRETATFSVGCYLQRVISQSRFSKKSTQATYKSRVNVLKKLFNTKKDIREIFSNDIENFYINLMKKGSKGYSKNMAKSLINLLNTAFNMALCDGIIADNPIINKKISILQDTKQAQPFSLSEIQSIIKNAENLNVWFKYAVAVSFFTGIRSGELLALKWEHIDLENGIISIECNMSRFGIISPKTQSSFREVEILEPLAKFLKEYKNLCKDKQGFLFKDSNNKPFVNTSGEFLKLWQAVLVKSNLTYRRFYITRHSFASVMLSGGESILWVSKMLGHKNANITLTTYAKYIKQDGKRASFLNGIKF